MSEVKAYSLSVALIAFNEANNLARTLASIKDLADEIVVVDSESTDATVAIAEQFGARIIVQPWLGYVEQKNFLFSQCHCDWILNLDCDEVVTPELAKELQRCLAAPQYEGYDINRKSVYLGKVMQYAWQPDRVVRLAKRSTGPTWQGRHVHERLVVSGEIGHLTHSMLHYSYVDLHDHILRSVHYAELAAKANQEHGKHSSLLSIIGHAGSALWRSLIARRGYKDGYRGIVAAVVTTFYVAMKYLFLYMYNNQAEEESV